MKILITVDDSQARHLLNEILMMKDVDKSTDFGKRLLGLTGLFMINKVAKLHLERKVSLA